TVNSILDSVYFSAWADPDLGEYQDDLVGCDTTINSGFLYNSGPDGSFGDKPPAFFINLLQGPYSYIPGETFIDNNFNGTYEDSIDTPLDSAYNHQGPIKEIQTFPGAKNQKMTAFTHYQGSDPILGDPDNEFEARNYMLGKHRQGYLLDPCTWQLGEVRGGVECNLVNPLYWYSGDPETNIGWINNRPTDQRMVVHTGPFALEVDKPITIIVGYTIGQGDSALNSVTVGKEVSAFVQQFYQSNFDDNILPVEEENNLIADEFNLYQNYPNPFNPSTIISYQIQEQQLVTLNVYDILGNEIAVLVNEEKPVGNYEVEFDASSFPSGVYFYKLQAGNYVKTKKMILLR
ncbi:MAG: T9SS type A sorting domain-containing protein, partial [Ignavibacteria bacterium]|nr:T9SS type A sorting domain-containing protein [Ignavibacteria bacterium]